MLKEIQYYCEHCNSKFVVYEEDTIDQKEVCSWCGNKVIKTNQERYIEGNYIITTSNLIEVNRTLSPQYKRENNVQ